MNDADSGSAPPLGPTVAPSAIELNRTAAARHGWRVAAPGVPDVVVRGEAAEALALSAASKGATWTLLDAAGEPTRRVLRPRMDAAERAAMIDWYVKTSSRLAVCRRFGRALSAVHRVLAAAGVPLAMSAARPPAHVHRLLTPTQRRALDELRTGAPLTPGEPIVGLPRGVRVSSLRALVRAGLLIETTSDAGRPQWHLPAAKASPTPPADETQ